MINRNSTVYRVSMDLLLSVAMGQHRTFQNQAQLANHFKPHLYDHELFCAYEWLDRAWFVKHGNQELYGNSALPLSTTDNMTTPIMHVIPAALLAPHITHGSRILDVGTGHGYIAMLLRRYADLKGYRDVSVKGLDVNEDLIQRARTLGQQLGLTVDFEVGDYLSQATNLKDSNMINIGFGVNQESLSNHRHTRVVAPLVEGGEQWLTHLHFGETLIHAEKIMKCVFQMAKQEKTVQEASNRQNAQELAELEKKVVEWNRAYYNTHGIKPTLEDMKRDQALMNTLATIRKLKRWIKHISDIKT